MSAGDSIARGRMFEEALVHGHQVEEESACCKGQVRA